MQYAAGDPTAVHVSLSVLKVYRTGSETACHSRDFKKGGVDIASQQGRPPHVYSNPGVMLKKVLSFASVGLFALAGTADAQIANTGTGGGATDPFWTVNYQCLDGWASLCTGRYSPIVGQIIYSPPSPPWEANDDVSKWIGATSTGDWPLYTGVGDEVPRLRYFFETNFLGGPSINGLLGWDNQLIGMEFMLFGKNVWEGFVAAADLGITPYGDGLSGFCRDGDGVYDGDHVGSCLATINYTFDPTLSRIKAVRFIVDGDGATDGFRFAGVAAGTVVPEPSTYLLMATGLLGLGIAARRRRS